MLVNTLLAFHSFGMGVPKKHRLTEKDREHHIRCSRQAFVIYTTFQLLTLLSFHLTKNSRFSKIRWALLSYASPSASITYLLGSTFCKVNALWKKVVLAVAIPVATLVVQTLQSLASKWIATKVFKADSKKKDLDNGCKRLTATVCTGLDHLAAKNYSLYQYLRAYWHLRKINK